MEPQNSLHVDCLCFDYDHVVRFSYYQDWGDEHAPELTVEMRVNDYDSFWQRVKLAWNFIFKRKQYGASCTTLIPYESANKVISFLTQYRSGYLETKNKRHKESMDKIGEKVKAFDGIEDGQVSGQDTGQVKYLKLDNNGSPVEVSYRDGTTELYKQGEDK